MISFFLNSHLIESDSPVNTILVDYLRYSKKLTGTKIGCREGDCGACTVLVGSINQVTNKLEYKSIVSCLTPLGNIRNKHIVTVEGLNFENNAIQGSFVTNGATQCGFCTPGFIMSATAFFLSSETYSHMNLINHLDGNICRCTGYKSIERACAQLIGQLDDFESIDNKIPHLIKEKVIPHYFQDIKGKLLQLEHDNPNSRNEFSFNENLIVLGGGTDLMVQQSDKIYESSVLYLSQSSPVTENSMSIQIDASCTTEDFFNSLVVNNLFKGIRSFKYLVASTPIRNIGTIAGNLANASPIGDLSIILLALNSSLILQKSNIERKVPLKDFFISYKVVNKDTGELITQISIPKFKSNNGYFFNFEKVSKRTHLDIASVNTALLIEVNTEGKINSVSLSAGGIAPIPTFLEQTCSHLINKDLSTALVLEAIEIAKSEVSPISDVRGSKEYKLLLLGQLIFSHFIKLFPNYINFNEAYI